MSGACLNSWSPDGNAEELLALRAAMFENFFTRIEIEFGTDAIKPEEVPIKTSHSGWMSPRLSESTDYILTT